MRHYPTKTVYCKHVTYNIVPYCHDQYCSNFTRLLEMVVLRVSMLFDDFHSCHTKQSYCKHVHFAMINIIQTFLDYWEWWSVFMYFIKIIFIFVVWEFRQFILWKNSLLYSCCGQCFLKFVLTGFWLVETFSTSYPNMIGNIIKWSLVEMLLLLHVLIKWSFFVMIRQ